MQRHHTFANAFTHAPWTMSLAAKREFPLDIEDLKIELCIVRHQLAQLHGLQVAHIAVRRALAVLTYREDYERSHPLGSDGYDEPSNGGDVIDCEDTSCLTCPYCKRESPLDDHADFLVHVNNCIHL